MRFSKAIVKRPSKSMVNGITSQNLGKPKYKMAIEQHNEYIKALEKAGVEVIVLDADERYPDSCFVEDTAVLTEDFAIITNPGADSRKGEVHSIRKVLENHYEQLYTISPPGTLEGGDVLRIGKTFFVGISERTNKEGASQFRSIVEKDGFTVEFVHLKNYLHLKTGISYIGNNTILVAGELVDNKIFSKYKKIVLNKEAEYAANSILVNNYLFLAKGFPSVKKKLENSDNQLIELEMSEFRKIDGGLSCLSLRF